MGCPWFVDEVDRLSHDIERALTPGYDPEFDEESECHTELVIIDEADRLRPRSVVSRRLVVESGFRFVPWA